VALRVASYNVLADAYLPPDRYARCDPEHLAPSRRHPRLAARVAGLAADIVCAQEVEADVLARFAAALPDHAQRYAPKPGRTDGVAVFARLPIVAERAIRFPDDTGRVALLVVVEYEGRHLGVACTHLKLDAAIGLTQAQALIDELARVPCDGWVVCGDLNAEPGAAIVERLLASGLADAHAGSPAFTSNFAGGPSRIDYVLHGPALTAHPIIVAPPITPSTVLPSGDEPSDHLPVLARIAWAWSAGAGFV
jgi:endonuclease/exonuclease/phosphatase family metal-dependent hydrolase